MVCTSYRCPVCGVELARLHQPCSRCVERLRVGSAGGWESFLQYLAMAVAVAALLF